MDQDRVTTDERSSFENSPEEDFKVAKTADEHKSFSFSDLNRTQKILFGSLGVFAIGILILTVLQFKTNLQVPWPIDDNQTEKSETAKSFNFIDDKEIEDLKNKDTDQDGISDYDELQIYNTSPYLDDSDSDGIKDKDEILQNEDPNCPQGKICFSLDQGTSNIDNSSTSSQPQPSAAELRKLLEASGKVTKEELSQISDQELVEIYQQMMTEDSDLSFDTLNEPTNINNYTPEQIRELLRQQGIDEETLLEIDDQTLLEMYQDALEEASKE